MKFSFEWARSLASSIAMQLRTFRDWFRILHEDHGRLLWIYGGFLLVSAVFPFVRLWVYGRFIDILTTTHGSMTHEVWLYLAGLIAVTMLPSFINATRWTVYNNLMLALNAKLDILLTAKQAELDFATHEDKEYQDLVQRVRERGSGGTMQFILYQFDLFANMIGFTVAAVVIAFADPVLFLVLFIATVPELIAGVRHGNRVFGIWQGKAEVRRRHQHIRAHFFSLPSLAELQVFRQARSFMSSVRRLYREFISEQYRVNRFNLRQLLFGRTLTLIAVGYVYIAFTLDVVGGVMSIGTLVFLVGAVGELRMLLSNVFQNLGKQFENGLFAADFIALLRREPHIKRVSRGIALSDRTPDIRFEDVSFTYPGTETQVLKHFSLHVPAGQRLALIGVNGAGKTTIVKLLCRFYDPTEGRILIDGHDLKTINLEGWYERLGVLMQDYPRYHFAVQDAIAVGRNGKKTDVEKVKEAAEAAEADAFIEEWDKSYRQQLGRSFTSGVEPSVGQWQKLAMARMFYRDPHVLVLDEPTSSMDAEAEANIFNRIQRLPKERTVIFISHRFSTVRNADHICVIDHGKVVEHGTHEELLAKDRTYARLFKLQAKGYQ